jgi:hypothetical protein
MKRSANWPRRWRRAWSIKRPMSMSVSDPDGHLTCGIGKRSVLLPFLRDDPAAFVS